MPINYEPAAPIAAYGNIYEQQARIAAQQRNAQLAAAASSRGNGSSNVPYDTGIQQAIFARDQLQSSNANQQADRETASNMQNDRFALESQLSNMQLTQQENMRLARMKNAIGDVQNDPTLSDEEKNDMTMQLKTGISPLAQRQAQASALQDQKLKQAHIDDYNAQAMQRTNEATLNAKTAEQRQQFFSHPKDLADIADDISNNLPFIPGVGKPPPEMIQQMAKQEAMRQGLGTWMFQEAPNKWRNLTEEEAKGRGAASKGTGTGAGRAGGVDHPTGLSPVEYLKVREQAEAEAHKEQQLTKEGDIPGTKTSVHPQSIEWKNERTRQIMQAKGLPADLNEYNGMKQSPQQTGYNPKVAPWNKGKQPQVAAAATPAGQGATGQTSSTTQVVSINKAANEQANAVLNDSRIPAPVRTQMAEKIGVVRRIMAEAGGDPNKIPEAKKAEFAEAAKFISENDPERGVTSSGQSQTQGQPAPEKPWYQKVAAGEYGKETLDIPKVIAAADLTNPETRANFNRGARRIGAALKPNLSEAAKRMARLLGQE